MKRVERSLLLSLARLRVQNTYGRLGGRGLHAHVMCIDAQMEVMVTTYQSIFEGYTLLEHWDFEIPKQYFQHSTALLSSS